MIQTGDRLQMLDCILHLIIAHIRILDENRPCRM